MSRFTDSFKYILLLLITAIPIFGFLDNLPIRIWDESRVAVNALEMYYGKDYLVARFEGEPDMWNTKPPLILWLQVLFMHLFGPGEIAIRLPSSFSVFFTCLALLLFCKRYLKNFWLGFIAVLCLITSNGYMGYHVARTGDYDAMLTLFTTVSSLFFYAFCETKQTKYLYWFFAALTLGAFTKGVAALLFTPALAIYALFSIPPGYFFRNKHFYIGLFSFFVLILSFYFARNAVNDTYIKMVHENELGGRFLESQGEHPFDFWRYYNNFISMQYADRYLLIPCGMLVGGFSKDPRVKKFSLFVTLLTITFFIVISSSKTKLDWYDAPLYPWFAILVALFIDLFFNVLRTAPILLQSLKRNVTPYLLIMILFYIPYRETWRFTYAPEERSWDRDFYQMGAYLKDALRGNVHMHHKYIVYEEYKAHILFYVEILQHQKVNTGFKSFDEIKKGDAILVSNDNTREKIKQHFKCVEIRERGPVFTLIILDAKPEPIVKA
ncbi:MAG: glycosyltransferase family 39 protein [Bacteroidia bacterium]|nr:glycosyltransferase family 39 protein [Bacteroidia bacterium]